MNQKAFTLIEVLIYVGITAVVGGLLTGILLTVSQVHQRESAATEVGSQLNFIIQRIGQLTRESSNIEITSGVSTSTLKLRMKDSTKDPTCISLVNGVIKLAEGPGANPNECSTTTSDLTNSRVIVDSLNFKKFTAYPGHDTVSIDIQLTYNSQNPKSQVTRNLTSAIARVSAATFDSNILPGSTSYEIGQQGSPWSRAYLSDGTALNPSYTFGNNTGLGLFRAGTNILGFTIAGTERMRIDASGNVGIGTSTPSELLHIYKSTGWSMMRIETDGTSSSGSQLELNTPGGSGVIGVRNDGEFGASSNLGFRVGAANAMVITNSGNVGIGTTAPSYKLQVGVGGDGTSAIANAWNVFSDVRTKTNISKINNALETVSNLEGVKFNWKESNQPSLGFIAQDVEKVIPEIVSTDQSGYKSLDYSKIIPVLTEAIKELKAEIKELKAENDH